MSRRLAVIGVALVATALAIVYALRLEHPISEAEAAPQMTAYITAVPLEDGSTESIPIPAEPEFRWGIADPEGGRFASIRSDWNDDPLLWDLRAPVDVAAIPRSVLDDLVKQDCRIPSWRDGTIEAGFVWGEFERPGQRDLAVLCAHSDKTSTVFIYWGASPNRRGTMPWSGSSISIVPPADVDQRADPSLPVDSRMPLVVDHDALEIACCECCSTIYYRYAETWFTLPGAD